MNIPKDEFPFAMTSFLRAVERRLRMPRTVRNRVMSDYATSLSVRLEQGERCEDILASLGSAKQAAAELNEQMKEFTYRKSPWRFVFLTITAVSALCLTFLLFMDAAMSWLLTETTSVGIIGGADGPTSIFVATSPGNPLQSIAAAALLTVGGLIGYLCLCRCRRR